MVYAQALTEFGQKIGVGVAAFRETTTECLLIRDVLAGTLKALVEQDVQDFVAAFGEALTLWIGLVDGPRSLEIEQGVIQGTIAAALGRIARSPGSLDLRIDLRIDKTSILKQHGLVGLPCHALSYIFVDNLVQALKLPLPDVDGALFASRDRPTLVFVSDAELCYRGYLLTIAGPKDIAQARAEAKPLSASLRSRLDKYHSTAREHLSWLGFQFQHLTPLHFLCDRIGEGVDELDAILADHTLHLSILYTANRSTFDRTSFEATYAGSEETARLFLQSGVAVSEHEALLPRLALWPHGGGDRDTNRLTLFQNTVARELAGDSPRENYRTFVQRLCSILGEARWHHRVFVDQQIDKHFEQVEKVTDYIAGVTKEVSQAIDALTKGLTDALLGAVGVVVLTMLATLLKGDVREFIVQLALWAYAAYLLLIQGAYRMGSIAHSYCLLQDETEKRLAAFREQLGKDRVKAVASPLERRKRQFWRWFVVTAAIYLAVIVLLCVLSFNLDGFLTPAADASPTATPVPTGQPTITPTA
ncbi:MAG: hypothetical protein JXA14_21195 [Anaerolineae bacterium]|nr:hypothetical protein [Anaerolineae bacterium]